MLKVLNALYATLQCSMYMMFCVCAKYEGEIADWYLYGCRVASAVSVIPKQGYTGLRQAALALLL